jgi:hypothetical protein
MARLRRVKRMNTDNTTTTTNYSAEWYERIDKHGIEAVGILARVFGHDLGWLQHIIIEQLTHADGCKCTHLDNGEVREYCDKWLAVRRYKVAEEKFEQAKKALESAGDNLAELVLPTE